MVLVLFTDLGVVGGFVGGGGLSLSLLAADVVVLWRLDSGVCSTDGGYCFRCWWWLWSWEIGFVAPATV
jgi:hypothetical protein